jgi:hypothetical protein
MASADTSGAPLAGVRVEARPPATLNAAAFPHILANVIAHAPYESLLLLRAVSHATKQAADARLAHHVILHIPGICISDVMEGPGDELDCRAKARTARILSTVPSAVPEPAPPSPAAAPLTAAEVAFNTSFPLPVVSGRSLPGFGVHPPSLSALAAVRVVDIPSTEVHYLLNTGEEPHPPVLPSLSNLEVVRYFSPWGADKEGSFPADVRRVYFVPLLAMEGDLWFIPCLGWYPSVVYHFTGTGTVPWDVTLPVNDSAWGKDSGSMTLIFTDVEPDEEVGKWASATAWAIFRRPRTQFILVDATPSLFGVKHSNDIVPALARIAAAHLERSFPGWSQYHPSYGLEYVAAQVELLSCDEYRERVGEELYALDMVGLHYPPRPS